MAWTMGAKQLIRGAETLVVCKGLLDDQAEESSGDDQLRQERLCAELQDVQSWQRQRADP